MKVQRESECKGDVRFSFLTNSDGWMQIQIQIETQMVEFAVCKVHKLNLDFLRTCRAQA